MSAAVDPYCPDCRQGSPIHCVGRAAGRYLVAIQRLDDGARVSTEAVSGAVGVEAPSTTEMLGKLADRSLVDHEHYRGAVLTDRGEAVARALRWRQQVVRDFFASSLDLLLDRETAYRIGYVLQRDAVERLDRLAEE